MPWVRSGSCTRCGDCCKGDPWENEKTFNNVPRPRPTKVAGYCALFEWHKGAPEGDGFCAGHEPPNQNAFYLKGCNVWPDHPSQLEDKPNCGYSFTWEK